MDIVNSRGEELRVRRKETKEITTEGVQRKEGSTLA